MKTYHPLVVGEEERQLLQDLLEERITNLEGHKAAIMDIPELAAVADEGWRNLDDQLDLARSVLEVVRG